MITTKEQYSVVLNRNDLDKLMEHLSSSGLAEVVVDAYGQIIFNIPKSSSLKINPTNPGIKIVREIVKLKKKLETLEEGTAPFKRVQIKLKHFEMALKLVNN
jgi:hypothetical protein